MPAGSALKNVRLPPAPVTVAKAPDVVIAAPGLTVTTVEPGNVVVSAPAVAGLAASQSTLAVFSPAQAASADCELPATSAMNTPVKAVLLSKVARRGPGVAMRSCGRPHAPHAE